jgi:hypothetical protein
VGRDLQRVARRGDVREFHLEVEDAQPLQEVFLKVAARAEVRTSLCEA